MYMCVCSGGWQITKLKKGEFRRL